MGRPTFHDPTHIDPTIVGFPCPQATEGSSELIGVFGLHIELFPFLNQQIFGLAGTRCRHCADHPLPNANVKTLWCLVGTEGIKSVHLIYELQTYLVPISATGGKWKSVPSTKAKPTACHPFTHLDSQVQSNMTDYHNVKAFQAPGPPKYPDVWPVYTIVRGIRALRNWEVQAGSPSNPSSPGRLCASLGRRSPSGARSFGICGADAGRNL